MDRDKSENICAMIRRMFMAAVTAVISAVMLASCGSVKTDDEYSPQLEDVTVGSYSEGSEDSQYVTADLIFDREIAVTDEKCSDLRITISDERVKDDECEFTAGDDENTARIKIPVDAVTKGILKIGPAEKEKGISCIRSADEKYAVQDFTLEALIPSGVSLSTVSSEPGKVVKSVDSVWNIRSIAWVGITENGELILVSETRALELLDGYAAVHGHEFLAENDRDIAAGIVETLQNNYGAEYSVSCSKNIITVEKQGSDAELDIDIYSYRKINGRSIK